MTMNTRKDADYHVLKVHGCTYLGPSFDARTHDYVNGVPTPYCGCKDLVPNTLYCAEHYPMIYAKGTALRKRHKDLRKVKQLQDLQQLILDIAEELEDEGWTPEQDQLFAE